MSRNRTETTLGSTVLQAKGAAQRIALKDLKITTGDELKPEDDKYQRYKKTLLGEKVKGADYETIMPTKQEGVEELIDQIIKNVPILLREINYNSTDIEKTKNTVAACSFAYDYVKKIGEVKEVDLLRLDDIVDSFSKSGISPQRNGEPFTLQHIINGKPSTSTRAATVENKTAEANQFLKL